MEWTSNGPRSNLESGLVPGGRSGGDPITWTYVIENTGGVTLTDISVTDDPVQTIDCGGVTMLDPEDDPLTCTATGTAEEGQYENTATVTATVGSIPEGVGRQLLGEEELPTVEDSDPSHYFGSALRITKTPDSQTVNPGQTASFNISLRNEGGDTITDIAVDDPLTTDCIRAAGVIPDLAPGGNFSYACQTEPLTLGFTNEATASGLIFDEEEVEAADTAEVVVSAVIGISKMPETQQINAGETASFSITIENLGGSTLTNVVVEDPLTPDCIRGIEGEGGVIETVPDLEPEETYTYACETDELFADLTNVATASADGVSPNSDSAFVDVITPIEISKDPDEQQVTPGGTASFTILVRNNSAETLTQVQVDDPAAPNCTRALDDLGPGATDSYVCIAGPLSSDLNNVATVMALDGGGNEVSDSDSAFVEILPDVEISKTPDNQQVNPGDTATFAITIRNASEEATLTNIVVQDPLTPDCIRGIEGEGGTIETIPDLGPGVAHTYTCETEPLFADLTNVDTVSADGVAPRSDSAFVDVITALEISKEPDEQEVNSGETATFSILVRNNSSETLTQVQVDDPATPNCSRLLDDLGPEEFVRYECTTGPLSADLTNVATVTAQDGSGNALSDSDSAFVKVFADIQISKTPDAQQVNPGQNATFTIVVTDRL